MDRRTPFLALALALLGAVSAAQAQAVTAAQASPAAVAGSTNVDSVAQTPVDGAAIDDSATTATQDLPVSDAEPVAQTDTPPADPRTQAEQDYDALYGASTQDYNPVADPTLPPPVELPSSYDPWEKLNRKVHRFNNVVDRHIATPLAKAYVAIVPRPVRLGVGNFFNNLGQPVSAVNALLQGKPKQAAQALGRFAINSTIGVVGIFDPATRAHLPNRSEDFGQTLGVWGWKQSRYVELPLFGPRTVRDVFGMVGDGPMAPLRGVEDDKTRVFLQGLQLVDVRTQLFAVDSMREGATDEYALTRDAWLQRRRYQIFGDQQKGDDSLPDYLRDDDSNPGVPADAMPIMPTDNY
ncbi:MAG TPA: VacJ family lipoprotein [Luteimonas sp.]|nr:VacJ family lipoprotein [Luteimonas sp.]